MPDTAAFRARNNLPALGCLAHVGVSGVCGCVHCVRDSKKTVDKQEETMAAKKIEIIRHKEHARVVVDGVDIPGHAIPNDSVVVPVDNDDMPRVRLELVARTVDVRNTVEDEQ